MCATMSINWFVKFIKYFEIFYISLCNSKQHYGRYGQIFCLLNLFRFCLTINFEQSLWLKSFSFNWFTEQSTSNHHAKLSLAQSWKKLKRYFNPNHIYFILQCFILVIFFIRFYKKGGCNRVFEASTEHAVLGPHHSFLNELESLTRCFVAETHIS